MGVAASLAEFDTGTITMANPPGRNPRHAIQLLGPALALLLLSGGCHRTPPGENPKEEARPVVARGSLTQDEQTTVDIFRKAAPSVVHVTTLVTSGAQSVGLDLERIPTKTGSGFIWDKQGHVVTNYHVLEDGDAVQVVLADHTAKKATVVGAYPDEDIAVLYIDASADQLDPVLVGTAKDLEVGQDVYAIGNPFGLDRTLTKGIVSALGRRVTSENGHPIRGMIQTDAAINPGNSGGPLLDSAGRLIGMNSSILSPSGAFAGVGFAIPVDEINQVVTQLIEHGKVSRPGMGIELAPDQWSEELNLPGVLVLDVSPGGPADTAGIRPTRRLADGRIELGDVIVALDNKPVHSRSDFFSIRDAHKAGDTVAVTVLREGQEQTINVKLALL